MGVAGECCEQTRTACAAYGAAWLRCLLLAAGAAASAYIGSWGKPLIACHVRGAYLVAVSVVYSSVQSAGVCDGPAS
jgi:hypothetical protein